MKDEKGLNDMTVGIFANTQATSEEIRKESGEVTIVGENAKLIAFIYMLLRDEIPAGHIESLLINLGDDVEQKFTNGWLARYAENIVKRLTTNKVQDTPKNENV